MEAGTPGTLPCLRREVRGCRRYTVAAALPQVPAEAGAMEEVDGHQKEHRESWDTGVVAVVAGTGAGFGAHWRQEGFEMPHRRGRLRASSLAAAAAGIAGGQQTGLEQVGGTAGAGQEQGDRQVNHRQRSPILGDCRM